MPDPNSIFPSPFSLPDSNVYYRFPKDPYTGIPGDPPKVRVIKGARVTAYGYGTDNAYPGHPNGGATIAFNVDKLRPKVGDDPQAHLGTGSFDDPSTAAVHPQSGIRPGSLIYVPNRGWFRMEDHTLPDVPVNTIDMWSGRSTRSERDALTPKPTDVTIYSPNTPVPMEEQRKGSSGQWLRHVAKMKDREPH